MVTKSRNLGVPKDKFWLNEVMTPPRPPSQLWTWISWWIRS
jgi:hypothetical protein